MSDHKQTISEQRILTLLQAYGGDPDGWPADQRQAMSAQIADSGALQRARREAMQLDALLKTDRDVVTVDDTQSAALAARIMDRLPAQTPTTSSSGAARLDWLRWPRSQPAWVLAGAAIVAVTVVMIQTSPGPTRERAPSIAFEEWAWQDVTEQSLSRNDQDRQFDVMDFIELESAADDA